MNETGSSPWHRFGESIAPQYSVTECISAPLPNVSQQLIEQFYEDSIERYGIDSEQAQQFAQHLSTFTGSSPITGKIISEI